VALFLVSVLTWRALISWQAHYEYTCLSSSLAHAMIDCEDISTPENDKGGAEGGRNLAFLDRHDVQCPENKVKHETLMKILLLEFMKEKCCCG
jgi:hypothetical protein